MSEAAGVPAITSARAIGLAVRSLGARRVALVTRGGGEGVVAADVLPGLGLTVGPFAQETQEKQASIIPSEGTGFINPVDFSAVGGFPGVFEKMMAIVDDDPETDIIIYQHQIEFAHLFRKGYNQYLLDAVVGFSKGAKKMLLVVLPLYYSGDEWLRSLIYLNERGVSTHPAIEGAAAHNLAAYEERKIPLGQKKGKQS